MKPAPAATLALLALLVLPGCTTSTGPSRPGHALGLSRYAGSSLEAGNSFAPHLGPPSDVAPRHELNTEAWEKARHAEADRALDILWSVAGGTNTSGAEWEVRFWSEGGALTLLSLRRTEPGVEPLAPISRGAFLPRLARDLPDLLGNSPREVILTMERHESGWSTDVETSSRQEPPSYARTIPSLRSGSPATTHQQVLNTARAMARLMAVPRGGQLEFVVQVSLEDDRVLGWEAQELNSSGDGPALMAGDDAIPFVIAALLPFTRGLGERTISLSLHAEHRHGEPRPRWRIQAAHVVEPAPVPAEVADLQQEYRQLHESILIEFQEQTREYAVLAAGFTLEQIAYSIVGGLALKGAWAIIGRGAPTIVSVLSKGGKTAVSWFRTLLVRAPAADKEVLFRLWMKAETQGLKALTEVEKQELRAVMSRLEKVLETPLDDAAKKRIWSLSREEYFTLHNPQFARLLGEKGRQVYEVHHLYPVRYAHLFPKLDINGSANLVGIHGKVHQSISSVWSSLGQVSNRMKPDDVQRVVAIINRHYKRWFDKLYDPAEAPRLAQATQAALAEVAELKVLLTP